MPFDGSGSRHVISTPSSRILSGLSPIWYQCMKPWCPFTVRRGSLPATRAKARVALDREVVALLTEARALIEDESNWAQGHYATKDHRYCAIGAVRAVARGGFGRYASHQAKRILHRAARHAGYSSMESLNDDSAHIWVLATFDTAISTTSEGEP
jgi:hypothetical protein